MWVLVMDIGMLGSICHVVGAITVDPGVSGSNILFAVLIWGIRPWFLVALDWIHSVWVVMMDVDIV